MRRSAEKWVHHNLDGHVNAHYRAAVRAESGGLAMKPLRIFVAFVLFAGASLTVRATYLEAKAQLAGALIQRAWDRTVAEGKPHPPWLWADSYPAARLRISRLSYDEILLGTATPRTPACGPARLSTGAGLGEPGNIQLTAHRTGWFSPPEALEVGDQIELQWFDTRKHSILERTYTVDDLRIVAPEEVNLFGTASEDALTLVTCFPFGRSPRSPQRFVVLASPAGPSHLKGVLKEVSRVAGPAGVVGAAGPDHCAVRRSECAWSGAAL